MSADLPNIDLEINDQAPESAMISFHPMTIESFLNIVKDLYVSKSCGIPALNTTMVIDAMKCIPEIFVKICNSSLANGKFPSHSKEARVTIIPKKGDLRRRDNLRPIAKYCLGKKI